MRNFASILLLSLASCQLRHPTEPLVWFDGQRAYDLVSVQMDFGPRIPGTEAHRQTGDWILDELERHEWQIDIQEYSYRGVTLRNITGKAGPAVGDPIILGAHYDTRPLSDRDSTMPEKAMPGANDGGSGVAVLLELARVLDAEKLHDPVWLVFFDAEDSGDIAGWDWIVGSRHYAENLTVRPEAVVVVDMVGDADQQLYFERNSTRALRKKIWATASKLGYESFIPRPRHSMLDDHTPFLQLGYPAVDIIDFDYPYWHTTEDTVDKISAPSLESVGRTLQAWLNQWP